MYVIGFGGWLVHFGFATAAAFRFAQQTTQRGLSNAAWSAFYNVIPADRRAQALAFNDGVPGQVGTVLSGILLLIAASLPGLEPVFWLGLTTAIVATIVAIGIRRGYAESLLGALRSGLAEQVLEGGPGLPAVLERPDFRAAVSAASAAPEPATRRLAVALLGRVADLRPEERIRLGELVDDPSPTVRAEVATALAGDPADPRPGALIAALIGSTVDEDRVAGLDAAARVPGRASTELIRPLIATGSPVVRAAAMRAAAERADASAVLPTALLVHALDDDACAVRTAAGRTLAKRHDAAAGLADVLRNGSLRAQDAAMDAFAGHGPGIQDDLLAWAQGQIERAETLQRARMAVATLDVTEDHAFLEHVIARRIRRAEDRAIAAVVAVGAPTAGGLMRRSLRSTDQDARAQAIEALDSLGDRRLGRALTACLEAATEHPATQAMTALETLTHDEDPWIARLSRRVLAAGRATDADEATMPDPDRQATALDTMLLLRRIPLFAGLEPEDLQRVAMVAFERDYPAGTPIMREGDIGDELVVIVEGGVRVVQAGADGTERFLRRYGAGDHIGELAVLRDRPRAATVIAETDVRGLVLGGDGLRSILRERPEAAMAMLATLAERISTQ